MALSYRGIQMLNPQRPLISVKSGETVQVASIDAGKNMNGRLAAMGLLPNTALKVVSNGHPGPFVIIVRNTRMMLGKGMAQKIMVR